MRQRLLQGLAIFATLFSALVLLLRPDIERHLKTSVPGNPMPDAFNGLNGSIPIFMILGTATLILISRIDRKRQYKLLLPLLFGPIACVVGWYLTENLNEPNWFHLFATTTIGMLVSCSITALMSIADR